ncbi:unnamed protein product [Trichogramma brassicae]|uniref:Uncharacterized protein n=1 Tax=Trichogramma brassicae TaxID=86971 RepID=A0A6H5IJD5_9HYME|nr:unnamed protein product [Trichogramma brassicae]
MKTHLHGKLEEIRSQAEAQHIELSSKLAQFESSITQLTARVEAQEHKSAESATALAKMQNEIEEDMHSFDEWLFSLPIVSACARRARLRIGISTSNADAAARSRTHSLNHTKTRLHTQERQSTREIADYDIYSLNLLKLKKLEKSTRE